MHDTVPQQRHSSFRLDERALVELLPDVRYLPPQYSFDCKGTRVREDAVSWRRHEDGYRVWVSAAFADRDQHFRFDTLPGSYEIKLEGKKRKYAFSTVDDRLAVTAEFFAIADDIFDPVLYLSSFRIHSFHCNCIDKRQHTYAVPERIHSELADLTGNFSPADSVHKLLRAQNRIVAQFLAQHEAPAAYHSSEGLTPLPVERPFTRANASLRRDEDALALRHTSKLLRGEHDLYSPRKVAQFIRRYEQQAA